MSRQCNDLCILLCALLLGAMGAAVACQPYGVPSSTVTRRAPPRTGALSHDADWIVRHRWVAADLGDACASCHQERECRACHDGRVRPASVHPNDWLSIHPDAARRDSPRCTSCHTVETFCTECHARLGISLLSAPLASGLARYHPPASEWVDGSQLHATEAKRSLSSCTSCHAERDCVTCHGARGVGASVSPHGPDFRCRTALDANPRGCRSCHGDLNILEGRCR